MLGAATVLSLALLASANPSGGAAAEPRVRAQDLRTVYGLRYTVPLGEFRLLEINQEEWTVPHISRDGVRFFVGTRFGRLQARDVASGDLLWEQRDLGAIGYGMAEFRGVLLVGSGSDLVAFDQQIGRERWRVPLNGAIAGDLVVTGTVALAPVRPNNVMAVDLVAGAEVWRARRPTPDGITVRGQAAALVDAPRNRAFLGFSDGSLTAVSLDRGDPRWVAPLGQPRDGFADVDAVPVLVDGGAAVIAASYNGGLYKLDAETGRPLWKRDHLRIIGLVRGAPGLLVATHGGGAVLGIDEESGQIRWRYQLASGWPTDPVPLGRNMVVVASSGGPLTFLDLETGRPIQLLSPGSAGFSVRPAHRDPDLVALSNKGTVLVLRYGSSSVR